MTLLRWHKLKKKQQQQRITKVGVNVEKLETLHIAWRNVKWNSYCENSFTILKMLFKELPYDQPVHF